MSPFIALPGYKRRLKEDSNSGPSRKSIQAWIGKTRKTTQDARETGERDSDLFERNSPVSTCDCKNQKRCPFVATLHPCDQPALQDYRLGTSAVTNRIWDRLYLEEHKRRDNRWLPSRSGQPTEDLWIAQI